MKMSEEEKKQRAEARKEQREIAKEVEKVRAEKEQKPVKKIEIVVEWKKSRTWGNCPKAIAKVCFYDGTFTRFEGSRVMGYGYDKLSTAVAEVLNEFLKGACYKYADNIKALKPYGIRFYDYKGLEHVYFEGGVGVSCYRDCLEAINGHFEVGIAGNTFDTYRITLTDFDELQKAVQKDLDKLNK